MTLDRLAHLIVQRDVEALRREPKPAPRPNVRAWRTTAHVERGGPREDKPRTLPLRPPAREGVPASPVRVRTFDPEAGPPPLSTIAELRARQ